MKHTPYFNLLEALKEGCPLCFLVKKAAHKLMDSFLYESVNDSAIRKEIIASKGFCNRHAWQLQKLGDGLGQAIVYNDLIERHLQELTEINTSASLKELIKKVSPKKSRKKICMFCKQEKDAEERYLSVFWESFGDSEFNAQYKNSFGLCLPHLSAALKKSKDMELSKELTAIESKKLEDLITELKEYKRKHDYRFSREKLGKEGDSWVRAIEKFMGKKGIYEKGV